VSWGGVSTWETREIGKRASRRDIKARSGGEAPTYHLKVPKYPEVTVVKNHVRMHRTQAIWEIASDISECGVSESDMR